MYKYFDGKSRTADTNPFNKSQNIASHDLLDFLCLYVTNASLSSNNKRSVGAVDIHRDNEIVTC